MTTKIKPSSPGQLQCQTLESPCWCPGCCSFQRPDFTSWIRKPCIIYDIWYIIYGWEETWAINSSFGERLLPAAALAFSSQRRRLEQSSWSWEQHRQNNICLDVLVKYWHNLEDHVVLPDVRVVCDGNILGHFGDPRNRNCGKVAANLRRSFLSPSSLSLTAKNGNNSNSSQVSPQSNELPFSLLLTRLLICQAGIKLNSTFFEDLMYLTGISAIKVWRFVSRLVESISISFKKVSVLGQNIGSVS